MPVRLCQEAGVAEAGLIVPRSLALPALHSTEVPAQAGAKLPWSLVKLSLCGSLSHDHAGARLRSAGAWPLSQSRCLSCQVSILHVRIIEFPYMTFHGDKLELKFLMEIHTPSMFDTSAL